MTLHIDVVTPERIVFQDEIQEVTVPTTSGQIGILPHHAPLLAKLAHGELVIKTENKEHYLAIEGGFIEVTNDNVTILADYAIRSEEIEAAKVAEAKKRAEKKMAERLSEEDFAEAQSELRRAIAQLQVVAKRRHRTNMPELEKQ